MTETKHLRLIEGGRKERSRVAVYARCVSNDPAFDEAAIKRQAALCTRDTPVGGDARLFFDKAHVGQQRPGYAALLKAISAREIDELRVMSFDRLHRDAAEAARLRAICQHAGCTIVVCR